MTVLPMPIQHHHQARLAWGAAAEAKLLEYAGWLFPDPDGDPAIPLWVAEPWRAFVVDSKTCTRGPSHPSMVNWPLWWERFVAVRLASDHRWKRAVERALSDPWYTENLT